MSNTNDLFSDPLNRKRIECTGWIAKALFLKAAREGKEEVKKEYSALILSAQLKNGESFSLSCLGSKEYYLTYHEEKDENNNVHYYVHNGQEFIELAKPRISYWKGALDTLRTIKNVDIKNFTKVILEDPLGELKRDLGN
jgi:hypothetical protein